MTVVSALRLRDFRCYERATATFGEGLTVVVGPNGAGKTNLLEGLYFASTGRSCRTTNEREVVRFGASATRVELEAEADDGPHEFAVGFAPGQPKRASVDGAPIERMLDAPGRPLMSVFLPDRLELVKGAPSLRRAHLDQFIAALWPGRAATRRAYAQTLAQRNALITRVRSGAASRSSLGPWDAQLANHGFALMQDRERAAAMLREPFSCLVEQLGLEGKAAVSYRPRSRADDEQALAGELSERVPGDLERGFTTHGPHRDELAVVRDERELRAYGSQGQQRLALLALLLAERDALADIRSAPPTMLLDDVMSELDRSRRDSLVELLRAVGGQSVVTATDLDHVPGADRSDVTHIAIAAGQIKSEALVA